MKKVTLYIAQSLDGYVATKNSGVAWLDNYFSKEFKTEKFIEGMDTVVQGNVTYKQFKTKHPGKNNYVFSNDADTRSEEGVIFVKGGIKKFINNLDKKTHKNIWLVGGPNLIMQFLNEEQIDEMIIFTIPVLLKEGIALFDNIKKTPVLSLKNIKKYKNDVVALHYSVKK